MTRTVARNVAWVALIAVYLGMLMTVVVRTDLAERVAHGLQSPRAESSTTAGRARDKLRSPAAPTSPAAALKEQADSLLGSMWRAVRLPLLAVALLGTGGLAIRLRARRRRLRAVERFELRPSREDLASPYQREKLFDAWHGELAPRWWTRLARGPSSLALEVHELPAGRQLLTLAVSKEDARMVEGRIAATYPDARLLPIDGAPSWGRHVIRLKKRRLFVARIQTVKDDEQALAESIVTTMARIGEPASVQLHLTPAPWLAHRLARHLLKSREQELTRQEHADRWDIGVDSVVEDKELKGALETQHRSLFWVEIRLASDSREAARALAGVFSESHSENALTTRKMRLRASLYARRIACAASNPVPSFLHGVLSSSELAALWSLPRQRAKTAQLVRAPVGRAPAPPQIARDAELQIMRDELGPVGLRPADRKYGLAFIGGQGVGKTSAMARTIAIDARDRDAALIVLDPKHDLAELVLSLIPEERTVWYMDLARPEVGFNPLAIEAEPSAVADVVLQAMREAHEPGAILSQSDEFLRNAAVAVCAVEPEPTLWHMYELLSPRRAAYRKEVVGRLDGQAGLAAVARYWAMTFPDRWVDARAHMAGQLAAPLNKINRLLTTPSVDVALRHPFALDLGRLIQRREVLIVNGALGEVGEQNAIVVLQFLLQLVHQAMKQQQRLPEQERVRVCLKIDEAHLVLTPSFATMLALHRAAGPLEVAAAWQYTEQVSDRSIRAGLKSLLRSRSMFAMGEVADAREQAEVAMEVYSDLIRSDHDDRERMRLGPDDIVRLPTFAAMNSWVADGARQSAFFANTLPIAVGDGELRERHLARQREAGAFWPKVLADPIKEEAEEHHQPDVADERDAGTEETASASALRDEDTQLNAELTKTGVPESDPAPEVSGDGRDSIETDRDTGPHDDETGERDDETGERDDETPATYLAVHRPDVVRLLWDRQKRDVELAERLEPQPRDLEILRALWRYEALLLTQIREEWWPDKDVRAPQMRMKRLAAAGWLRRFRMRLASGAHQPGFVLARRGFLLAQKHRGPGGPYIPDDARWRERRISDYSTLAHLLQTNAWVLAYRRLIGDHAADWLGEHEGRLGVPTKAVQGRRRAIEVEDLDLGRQRRIRDLKVESFERVWPDATVTVDMPHRGRVFDLMVELDRTNRPVKSFDKFRRYDALITGWWRAVERYRKMGEPPAAVFVCTDEAHALSFMRGADREVTGRLARPGTAEQSWPYPGRERMLFVCERDVHEGSLRAWKLPAEPAATASEFVTREVQLPGRRRGAG